MTMREELRWWLIGLAVLAALLWLLAGVLLPFLLGAGIAYFTDPLAARLERRGHSRLSATVLLTGGSVSVILLLVLLLVPPLLNQLQNMIAAAPDVVEWLREVLLRHLPALAAQGSPLHGALAGLRERADQLSLSLLKGLWSGGLALIDFISLVVITPVVAFYFLLDWRRLLAAIDDLLPRGRRETIHRLARDIDRVLAGFVRGQLSVCAILGAFYALALTLIGLRFGLLIGGFAGLISFIPFLGSILGGVMSIGVALWQFWGQWEWVGAVVAVFVFGQVVEGNFLTPKLVGGSVGLHPVWLLFALSAFGSLFGFAGLLVAVPAAASIGVLVRFAIEQYKAGAFYSDKAQSGDFPDVAPHPEGAPSENARPETDR